MSNIIGQPERATQNRVVKFFRDQLGYDYLGDLHDKNNSNLKPELLTAWLTKRNIDNTLINRALDDFTKKVTDASKSLYDRNYEIYNALRYGIKVKPNANENNVTVWLIDWKNPQNNHFTIAEEVTVKGASPKAGTKRPDIVIYVNGIALGILELKRATVSVSEGIRQNLDNQKEEFIEPFFSTMQLVMAGNDSEGLRYGTIGTPEVHYLKWVENEESHDLDLHLSQICEKSRFLELIHDFTVFDAGIKKLCRHNQYFGVKAAQASLEKREGGIIWHTQGSGKSLTMVWLAKWIRENNSNARVLIITDRTELDQQIETVFGCVNEHIYRTPNGGDLIEKLNGATENLICSLVHKFGNKLNNDQDDDSKGAKEFIEELKKLPKNFKPKGDFHVFVDECHRTQSGELHDAMKAILPNALFIGFTGTPLLKSDKKRSIEVFGRHIHTYKFDQAVREGVVLDLRYEARDIDQKLSDTSKIDIWFKSKTKGLTDTAKARLKEKWGTMQRVLSSKSRLEKIVFDIIHDMNTKDRLMDGHGNAMLVASC